MDGLAAVLLALKSFVNFFLFLLLRANSLAIFWPSFLHWELFASIDCWKKFANKIELILLHLIWVSLYFCKQVFRFLLEPNLLRVPRKRLFNNYRSFFYLKLTYLSTAINTSIIFHYLVQGSKSQEISGSNRRISLVFLNFQPFQFLQHKLYCSRLILWNWDIYKICLYVCKYNYINGCLHSERISLLRTRIKNP